MRDEVPDEMLEIDDSFTIPPIDADWEQANPGWQGIEPGDPRWRPDRNGQARLHAPGKPTIQVIAGELDTLATAAEAAISTAGLPIFQRGDCLVRPVVSEVPTARGKKTVAAGLRELKRAALLDAMAQSAAYVRYDARRKKLVPCDPPPNVAEVMLARAGAWTVPSVAGVITTPTLRPDGTILCQQGYDAATRLYLVATPDLILPPIPAFPTRQQAEASLVLLNELLAEFQFVGDQDRAVALSGIITPVVRGALPVAPLHAFRASTPGSGKSYLVDLASSVATGRPCPAAAVSAKDGETESRLVGLLLAGFAVVSLDNVNGELGSDLLCQAVERPLIRLRALGRSDIIEVESRATLYATGNNLRVRGDMTRRTLVCTIDPKTERPELREFSGNPIDTVLADRGAYVAACITIVRAYQEAGAPNRLKPIASFETWSDLVRSALVWLGVADPAATMEVARNEDPELSDLREVLTQWQAVIGVDERVSCRAVADRAAEKFVDNEGESHPKFPELLDVLHRIAGEGRGVTSTRRLGKWLQNREGRIAGGLRLVKDRRSAGIQLWQLKREA